MRLILNVCVLAVLAGLFVVTGCADVIQPMAPTDESNDDTPVPDDNLEPEVTTADTNPIPASAAVDFGTLVDVQTVGLSLADLEFDTPEEPEETEPPQADPEVDPSTDPGSETPEDDTVVPEDSPTLDYYAYVLIVDETPNGLQGAGGTYGADIVTISHGGGPRLESASTLHAAGFGPGDNSAADNADDALGGISGGCGFENNRYVSLGGAGNVEEGEGYIIVSFGDLAPLEEGHVIGVSECHVADEMTDYFSVYVGNSPNLDDPNWVICEEGADSGTVCQIPALPPIE